MTGLELWTRIAIWLLIGGSVLVFAWFAYDLLRSGLTFGPSEERHDEGEL